MAIVIFPKNSCFKSELGIQINHGHPLAQGLIGCWLFNESGGSQVYNLCQPASVGILDSSATTWAPGRYSGTAGSFIASTGFTVGSTFPAVSAPMSVVASIFTTDYSQNGMIVERESVNATWELFISGGNVIWRGADANNRGSVAAPANSLWHQIVVTDDGTTSAQLIYLDGVLPTQNGSSGAAAPASNNNLIHFGYYDGFSFPLSGKIEYIYIYNRVLTASEVAILNVAPFCFLQPQSPQDRYFGIPAAAGAGPTLTIQWQGVDVH